VSKRKEIERLVAQLEQGGIPRREFVLRALALGASVSSVGALLQACQRKDKTVAAGAADSTPDLGPIGKQLHIYNWSDYIADNTVPDFEKEFGVKVTYDTYESNEEMVAKLQAGATVYDIVVPSGYIVPVMVATDLITPINKKYLTNFNNLSPIFQNLPTDPGNKYTVPWQWGTSGIAYRTDKIKTPVDSWAVFQDKRFAKKMTMMDDGREVIGSQLRYRGHSLNSTNATELKQAKAEQPNLGYVIPKEGCTIWGDSMCIPKSAPNKRAAHEWMNYILRPPVGAALSEATGYGTPNAAAAKVMKNPVPYPTEDELKRLEYQVDLGKDTATWDQIWTEIKSA
jgi:spermidine/putrescine transport system substrate-binding protein